MKLHELSPAEGSKKLLRESVVVPVPVKAKLPVKVIRVQRLVQATAVRQALKAVDASSETLTKREVSTIFSTEYAVVNLSSL